MSVNFVPILFRFKCLPYAKAVNAIHLYLAQVKRDTDCNEYDSQTNEGNRSLDVHAFHLALCTGLILSDERDL